MKQVLCVVVHQSINLMNWSNEVSFDHSPNVSQLLSHLNIRVAVLLCTLIQTHTIILVVDIRGHFSPAFPQVLHEFTHEPTIHAHILHIFSVMLNTADHRRYSMYLGGYWAPPRVDKWGGHAIASTPPAGFARWQPPDAKEHGHVLSKRLQVTEAGASATSAVNLPPALLPSSNHNLTG